MDAGTKPATGRRRAKGEMLNINQVKYFSAAVELGSFSDAARKFSVTTQAISKSIAELEREIGHDLLIRDKSGVYPNQLGMQFLHKAEAALEAFDDLESFVDDSSRKERTHELELALCVPMSFGQEAICSQITKFVASFLDIEVGVATTSGDEGLKAMREGTFDALITIGTLTQPGITCQTIGFAPPLVCMGENHPLAGYDAVTMGQLADYPVAFFPIADRFNKSILNTYLEKGLASPVRVLRQKAKMLEFYAAENGYSFILAMPGVSNHPFVFPGNVARPLAAGDSIPIPLCISWSTERTTPQIERLVKMLSRGGAALLK